MTGTIGRTMIFVTIFGVLLFAQSSPITITQLRGTGELVGSGPVNLCSRSQVNVLYQTATTLTIAAGAAPATPQHVRLVSATAPRTRSFTAPVTLSVAGGAGVGSTIEIWAVPTSVGMDVYVINNSGSTLACTPTCVVTQAGTPTAVAARAGVKLATWTVTGGSPVNFSPTGGTLFNTAFNCDVISLSLYNTSASAVTVSLKPAGGLQVPWIGPLTINPGGLIAISTTTPASSYAPAIGTYQEGGVLVQASTGGVVALHYSAAIYVPQGQ